MSSPSIVKVWLRFPSDAEDSYTSLPCASDTLGSDLAHRVALAVKKKRGLSIDVGGANVANEQGHTNVWQLAMKTTGQILTLEQKVVAQLPSGTELKLVLAPEATTPKYDVGMCVYASAAWCPAQAFITYLVSSGQLPLAEGVAFSRRCFEEGIVGLKECVTGLTDNEADLEGLKQAIGDEKHARVLQTVAEVQGGTHPDGLKAFLKPVKRKGHRMRSVIITDPNQVVATVHAVPKASISHDNRGSPPPGASNGTAPAADAASPSPPSSASAASPSSASFSSPIAQPAASPSPATPPPAPTQTKRDSDSASAAKRDSGSTPAAKRDSDSAPAVKRNSSSASSSAAAPPSPAATPSPIPASSSTPPNVASLVAAAAGAADAIVPSSPAPLVTPVRPGAKASIPPPSGAPPPPPPPKSLPHPGKSVEVVVDAGVLVERVQEWPTVVYDVTKINERGRRQARQLRLTATQIQNIKGTDTISSRHGYDEVFCVTLSDHETLVISYTESHDYTYVSPVALQIVGDINDRISRKREKQKEVLSTNLNAMALKWQEKMFRKEQKQKSASQGSAMPASMMVAASAPVSSHSALSDVAREMETLQVANGTAAPATSGADPQNPPAPSSSTAPPPPTRAPPSLARAPPTKSTLKLQQVFGTTHEQRLQVAIDTIILESTSDAGRARARFLKNFDTLEKTPATMLDVVRRFMDSLKAFVETKRIEEIRKATGLTLNTPAAEGEEELSSRIERSVEGRVVQPAFQRIMTVVKKLASASDDAIAEKLLALRRAVGCDQSFYGIPSDSHNVNNWSSAIEELNDMDKKLLPCEKLKCLLQTAKAIYTTFNHDRVTRAKLAGYAPKAGQYFLSADDFFPIFVFCVAQSSLACLETTRMFMFGLCERSALNGEGGYMLTVFEAATEYIRSASVDEKAK